MLSVVVPAYQEGPRIYESLRTLLDSLELLRRDYEVIVVSDGNTDATVEEAGRHASHLVKILHYDENRGKGFALRHGVEHASGSVIAFIDADMELHPVGIGRLLRDLEEGGLDAVVGSKVHPESKVHYPAFRRFQSRVFRTLARLLFRLDIADTQTGLKVFRREPLEDVIRYAQSDGFAFDLELLVLVNDAGYRIAEGPIELAYQFSTTTGVTAVIDVLRDMARIAIRRRRRLHSPEWTARRRERHG